MDGFILKIKNINAHISLIIKFYIVTYSMSSSFLKNATSAGRKLRGVIWCCGRAGTSYNITFTLRLININ